MLTWQISTFNQLNISYKKRQLPQWICYLNKKGGNRNLKTLNLAQNQNLNYLLSFKQKTVSASIFSIQLFFQSFFDILKNSHTTLLCWWQFFYVYFVTYFHCTKNAVWFTSTWRPHKKLKSFNNFKSFYTAYRDLNFSAIFFISTLIWKVLGFHKI